LRGLLDKNDKCERRRECSQGWGWEEEFQACPVDRWLSAGGDGISLFLVKSFAVFYCYW